MIVLRALAAFVIYCAVGAAVWSVIEGHLVAMDDRHIVRDRAIAIVGWPFAAVAALILWFFIRLSAIIDKVTGT